jgi:hypothetical protein
MENEMNPMKIHTTRRVLLLALASTLLSVLAFAHDGMEHVSGVVAKVSDQSVLVTTAAGKTVEVMLAEDTTYTRVGKPMQKSDLTVGDHVLIHAVEKGSTLTAHTVAARAAAKKP